MKNRIKISCFVLVIITLICATFTGCKTYYWQIEKSIEEIESIEITYLHNFYNDEYDVICEIPKSDYSEIIKDIESLKAVRYIGSRTIPSAETVRITFINGDYDLICLFEPRHIKSGIDYHSGLCFKKEQFEQFIEKWSTK